MTNPLPSPATPNLNDLLLTAQQSIAKKNFQAAADVFTKIIDYLKPPNPALLLISRCTCYLELKKYTEAAADALEAIKLPSIRTPQEIITGCYTSHSAAAYRAAQCYEKMGDTETAQVYKKMATELVKKEVGDSEKAEEVKEEGNSLFKEGKVKKAIEKWEEALKLDSGNASVLSNLSLAYLKTGDADRADMMADRCISSNPTWAKAYYRK
ncbi:hypothetical protein HDV05_001573, partial [Chytridiales sp. JEL 0842]